MRTCSASTGRASIGLDATLDIMGFVRRPARSVPSHHRLQGLAAVLAMTTLFASGCASPGPPHAPSLGLPQPVSDLTASRTGDVVELRFTVPHLSTDKLPLYNPHHHRTTLQGRICRSLTTGDCPTVATITATLTATDHTPFVWHESLSSDIASGEPRLLRYQVEFLSPNGRSAGRSNTAFTAAGSPPTPVAALHATGTRAGILLDWSASNTGEVLLHRSSLAPTGKHDTDVWLQANAPDRTIDNGVAANEPYRYTAERRLALTLGRHTVDLRSSPSAPVDLTLHPIYPPATPTGLAATAFMPPPSPGSSETPHFAIDLIWQPVADGETAPALAAPLTGYNVYREPANGGSVRARLNPSPLPGPSFHDPTADPATAYRYSVTAVDGNNNESKAAIVLVEPSPQ